MFLALALLFFGKLQDVLNLKARYLAAAFGAISAILPLLFGGGLVVAFVNAVVGGLYSWGYLALLARFRDTLSMWLAIYLLGAVLPVLLTSI